MKVTIEYFDLDTDFDQVKVKVPYDNENHLVAVPAYDLITSLDHQVYGVVKVQREQCPNEDVYCYCWKYNDGKRVAVLAHNQPMIKYDVSVKR